MFVSFCFLTTTWRTVARIGEPMQRLVCHNFGNISGKQQLFWGFGVKYQVRIFAGNFQTYGENIRRTRKTFGERGERSWKVCRRFAEFHKLAICQCRRIQCSRQHGEIPRSQIPFTLMSTTVTRVTMVTTSVSRTTITIPRSWACDCSRLHVCRPTTGTF